MASPASPVLLASGARHSPGKFAAKIVLLVLALIAWVDIMRMAVSSNRLLFWIALALYSVLCFCVVLWRRRVYFHPATGGLYEESGWPWLRLTFGKHLLDSSGFERVLCTEVKDDTGAVVRVELTLDGKRPYTLPSTIEGALTLDRTKAAAIAMLLQLPLEERPGSSGRRNERPPKLEMLLRVERALRAEVLPTNIAVSCGAMLFGNTVTLLGVLFAGWSAVSVYALFWLDLCAIVLFMALRLASGDYGREIGRFAQVVIALVFAGGAMLLLGLAGETIRAAIELPRPPVTRMLGFELPAALALVWHGIREGGAWFALLALVAGDAVAFAVDWRRGETSHRARIGRLIAISLLRILFTMGVACVAAVFLMHVPGAGSSAVLAVLIAARGAFEVWAHPMVHAPLWLSGDLDLMRAARAAASRSRPA